MAHIFFETMIFMWENAKRREFAGVGRASIFTDFNHYQYGE